MVLALVGLLAAAATAFVLHPVLVSREPKAAAAESETDRTRLRLEEKRDQLLLGLAELDFEHDAGKLGDEEHRQIRSRLLAEAARVTARLDRLKDATGRDQPER